MKQCQSRVFFFVFALLSSAARAVAASHHNRYIGIGINHRPTKMIGNALQLPSLRSSQKSLLAFAGNSLLYNASHQRPLTRSMLCAKKTTPLPSTTAMQFTPFAFPNLASTAWSPLSAGPAMSYSTESKAPDTRDNFSRYSKFLVKNSNGVDGLGKSPNNGNAEQKEDLVWVDTLGGNQCPSHNSQSDGDESEPDTDTTVPRPFSILSWNILAQTLYESQYQRRRIQQVALSSSHQKLQPSPHPHPWPKRLKRIIEILTHANPDIICLQECELHSFKHDLAPALSKFGYDGIAQEDDRPEGGGGEGGNWMPTFIKEATKHRDARNHIAATFWKRDTFECVGEASVRTRTLTVVLRPKKTDDHDHDDDDLNSNDGDSEGKGDKDKAARPTVAVVNVHLEGHPRRFSERTHQLQHAMTDLAKRIEHEENHTGQSKKQHDNQNHNIGKLNALLLVGDFNCELQSSACSTYLRMGRLGRQAGLGGVHGEDSIILPPSLLESTEATEVIHPIIEWGRALPEELVSDVNPHPFRRNGMTSAYPAWLGRDDATQHFTFCSELSKRPVPGLDQLWYTSMTLERTALRNMFADDSGLWERYFYDDAEVEKRRDEERAKVLASGLPSLDCKYPSDHLPIGATFDWKWGDCGNSCLVDGEEDENNDDSTCDVDEGEVRGLNVVDSEGNNIQDESFQDHKQQENKEKRSFETPHEELAYLLGCCPFDSKQQQSDVHFILSPLDPPLAPTSKHEKPTPEQMKQLEERRNGKAELLKTASLGVRSWLKNIWKVDKQVGKWNRLRAIEEAREMEKV